MKAVASPETEFINLHQDLIDGCRRGDQKSQFQIYKLYYKAMYNTSLRIVNNVVNTQQHLKIKFLEGKK